MLRRRYVETLARTSVTVHTTDGRSIAGVLAGTYRDVIVLERASMLVERGDPVELEGDAIIPRDRVSFLQSVRGAV